MVVEGSSKIEIQYNPDTPESILQRAQKVKEVVKQLEKAGQRPSQEELNKIVFRPLDMSRVHLDLEGYFEDY